MRPLSLALILFVLLSLISFAVPSLALDDYETDNDHDLAREATMCTTERHTLHTATDEDWLRFPVMAGGEYALALYSGTQAEPVFGNVYMLVYDENGRRFREAWAVTGFAAEQDGQVYVRFIPGDDFQGMDVVYFIELHDQQLCPLQAEDLGGEERPLNAAGPWD